jgi:hypothetical protein
LFKLLNGETSLEGGTASRSKTWFCGQDESKQPAIKTPAETMGVIASSLFTIQPPPEAGLLEALGDSYGIPGRDALEDLQCGVGQKAFQTGCR